MKTTKRALFSSVMALILCFSMLVGTTFAWFTDEVKSDVNKIVAGNLDIELEYKNVVNGQLAANWTKVQGASEIFNPDALWEPGRVEVVYLKVSNLGTLALKYQLGVNFEDTVIGESVTGKELKLSEHLAFKVVELKDEPTAAYTRDEAAAAAGTETGIADYNGVTTELKAADFDYVALIVYMPESVGNDANYKTGTAIPKIELGINLYATQLAAEEEKDSFGDDYDEDAWHPDMFVTTAAELAKAIEEVKDGGIIALSESLTFDKDSATSSGGSWFEGLYYVGDKSFTIDLKGKTITNDSAVNDYLMLFKNDGDKANTITIKNGTLEATSSAYCAICTSTTSTQKITINLENVNVIGNNSNGAVAKIRGGAELNVKAGTVITGKNSYIGIEAAGKNTVVNIYDGAEIYQKGTSSYCGSLVGVSGGATANVYGGSGVSAQGGFIAMTSGGTINVYGGEWIANTNGANANGNKSVLIAQSDKATYKGGNSVINVTGGTFKGGYNCYGNAAGDAQINISAGTFNADPSTYVASGFKAVANNGSYTVIFPQESFDNLINNAGANATIEIPAGEYTFPASKLQAGQTLNCAPGTVFNGKTGLNINGATVIGATFTNQNGYLVNSTTINGTFKDCVFTDCDGLRYCYAGETVVFENCVFDTDFYGVHFDGGANEVLFKNCTFTGFNTFGGAVTMLTMEGCTFKYNGNGGYNGINLWGDATLTDCTFVFDGSAAYEWVDLCNDNKTVTFTNCVVTDGKTEKGVETVVGIYGEGNTVLVDGVYVVGTADTLKAALSSEAENVKIVLSNDVSIDIGTGWKMGGANTESITIDGNDKVLTLSSTYRSYFNLANAEGVLNLKNMTLTNTHKGTHFFDYTTHFNCDVVAENVVFAKSPLVSGGATAVFNDCAFSQAGTDIYGLWIMSGTNVTVNGGELTTDRGFKIADEDSAKEMTTLKVSGTKFNNTKKAAILVTTDYGAQITLENLDITNCGADSTNAVWIDDGRTATADQITVTGGSVIIEP